MYTAERHFVTTAKAQLRLLSRSVAKNMVSNDVSTDTKASDTQGAIHKIKLAASPVKARAIYRAALLCEDTLNRYPVSNPKFQTSLNGLKSLIGLYTEGLLEIDPDFKSVLLDRTATENNVDARAQNKNQDIDQDISQDALLAANESAANTLEPLLKLVRNDTHANALSNALVFLTKHDHIEAQKSKFRSTRQPHSQPSLRFEALMRQITNRTLRHARAIDKDISISYAADFEAIEKKTALVLQAFLENTCLQILKTGLPNNESGHKRADHKRTWQISLTGSRKAQSLTIIITWPGQALRHTLSPALHQALPNQQSFQSLGGTLKNRTKKNADRDNVGGYDTGLNIQVLEITCPISAPVSVSGTAQAVQTTTKAHSQLTLASNP